MEKQIPYQGKTRLVKVTFFLKSLFLDENFPD